MSQENYDIGTCCFCGEECNFCSQSCGRCSRSLTGYSLGMNPLPKHLYHVYDPDAKMKTPNDKFKNENYQGQILYTGIGSESHLEYMSEGRFRRTIWLNMDEFSKKCPYDPRKCSLRLLVKWTGAKLI
jgi:hypothetical protein